MGVVLVDYKKFQILFFTLNQSDNPFLSLFSASFSVFAVTDVRQAVLRIAEKEPHLLYVSSDVPPTTAVMLLKILLKHRPTLKIAYALAPDSITLEVKNDFLTLENAGVLFLQDSSSEDALGNIQSFLVVSDQDLTSIDTHSNQPEAIEVPAGLVQTQAFSGLPTELTKEKEHQRTSPSVKLPLSDILSGYSREKKPSDPFISIVISPDLLHARLVCYPTSYRHNLEDIRMALTKAGVMFGVNETKIELLLLRVNIEKEPILGAVIATGLPPVDGQDGKIIYNFHQANEIMTREDGDGRVNYKAMHEIPCVKKGDLLAAVVPHTEPVHGCGVDGTQIKGRTGKPALWLAGRGVVHKKEENRFYAEIDGYASLIGKKIQVLALYNVPFDVDYSTGNIDFIGTVVVNGNISAGFSVRAQGDVIVQGVIEASARVYSGGNIVAKGVVGGEQGLVEALGNIRLNWCQDATIQADGNVDIVDAAINSQISSMGFVTVQERKGTIIGGQVRAVQGCRAKVIGSRLEVPTMIVAGEHFRIMDMIGEINRLQKANRQNLMKVQQGLKSAAVVSVVDQQKRERIQKLAEINQQLADRDQDLEQKKQSLLHKIEEKSFAKVSVKDFIYGNTKIQIGNSLRKNTEQLSSCSFYDDGVSVCLGLYEAS